MSVYNNTSGLSMDQQLAQASASMGQANPALGHKRPATEQESKEANSKVAVVSTEQLWRQNKTSLSKYSPKFTYDDFAKLNTYIQDILPRFEEAQRAPLVAVTEATPMLPLTLQGVIHSYMVLESFYEPSSEDCPNSLFYSSAGKLYVLFNKASQGDMIIYTSQDGNKKIKTAWLYGSTNWFASASLKNPKPKPSEDPNAPPEKPQDMIALAINAIEMVRGIPGTFPTETYFPYTGKSDGVLKLRVLTPMAIGSAGDLNGTFTREERQSIIRDLVAATVNMHAAGVIHRDIKPDNTLFTQEIDPKTGKPIKRGYLADFDFTCRMSDPVEMAEARGSLWYLSPELWQVVHDKMAAANANTPASQIWALGVTCHSLMKGAMPIWETGGGDISRVSWLFHCEIAKRHQPAGKKIDTKRFRTDWWPEPGTVFARMLEIDPAKRITDLELCKEFNIPVPPQLLKGKQA